MCVLNLEGLTGFCQLGAARNLAVQSAGMTVYTLPAASRANHPAIAQDTWRPSKVAGGGRFRMISGGIGSKDKLRREPTPAVAEGTRWRRTLLIESH